MPAEGRLLVPLEELAPDRTALALGLQATRGRVAAALRHSRVSGATARGLDLAAASPGPSDDVVVPALPAGPGGRALLLANPGDVDVGAGWSPGAWPRTAGPPTPGRCASSPTSPRSRR